MSYLSYPVQWQAIALSTLLTAYCFTMYEVLRSSIYVCAVVLWPQMKNQPGRGVFYLFIFNSIPFILFGLLFVSLLHPSRNSDRGSHSTLLAPCKVSLVASVTPPSPLPFVPCIFIARRFQLLPSSTRVELCLPTPNSFSQQLILFLVCWMSTGK